MDKAITLTGLKSKSSLSGKTKCTPVRVESKVDGKEVTVCQEDLANVKIVPEAEAPRMQTCKRISKNGKCLGRPRGSSPKNKNYKTKKGESVEFPFKKPAFSDKPPKCPAGQAKWVPVTVGGGKKAQRCRCFAPDNKRYVENKECD